MKIMGLVKHCHQTTFKLQTHLKNQMIYTMNILQLILGLTYKNINVKLK